MSVDYYKQREQALCLLSFYNSIKFYRLSPSRNSAIIVAECWQRE